MARTPEGRRVKSVVLGGLQDLATGIELDEVAMSYQFLDDVRIIGLEISCVAEPDDAASNSDGRLHLYAEVSRSSLRGRPGSLGIAYTFAVWNALIAMGSFTEHLVAMFPEGYGIDIDEGEHVNLLAYAHYTGGAGPIKVYENAVLYYVER